MRCSSSVTTRGPCAEEAPWGTGLPRAPAAPPAPHPPRRCLCCPCPTCCPSAPSVSAGQERVSLGSGGAGAGSGSSPRSPTPQETRGPGRGPYKVLEVADQPLLGIVPCQQGFAARRQDVELAEPAGTRGAASGGLGPLGVVVGAQPCPLRPALARLSPFYLGGVPARDKRASAGSRAPGPPRPCRGGPLPGVPTCRCGSWPPCGGCGHGGGRAGGRGLRTCWPCAAPAGACRRWACWAAAPPQRRWGHGEGQGCPSPGPPSPPPAPPPPLQQVGEQLPQPLLQEGGPVLQWVPLVGHLLPQVLQRPQQLQQLEEPLAQLREPAGTGGLSRGRP